MSPDITQTPPAELRRNADISSTTRRVTFSIFGGPGDQDSLITLEIFPDMTFETVQLSLEAESNIPVASQQIYYGGRLVTDTSRTMEQLGVSEGEVLAVHVRRPRQPRSAATATSPPAPATETSGQTQAQSQPSPDPELVRIGLLEDPAAMANVRIRAPHLAAVVNNPAEFHRILREDQEREQREHRERQREINQLNQDPWNEEYQKKIEEMIRQERVMENLQNAMEFNPEGSF